MSGKFSMDDYVDVAERIAMFTDKYPDGSLQSKLTALYQGDTLVGWLCVAKAYRTPDDKRPGVGHAMEPVPGKTPYTRDSEAMNAETSAWGRAIIALGFQTKKIASANEVRNRQTDNSNQQRGLPAIPASGEAISQIMALIPELAALRGTTVDQVREAIESDNGPINSLSVVKADELHQKMLRWQGNLAAAQGSGGEPDGTSPATVEPAAPDAPVAVNTTQSSTPGDAVVFSPPDTGSAGDTSGDGDTGTEAAGSPADTPFKAPTAPRGAKRKAAAA